MHSDSAIAPSEAERVMAVRSLGAPASGPTPELAALADLARDLLQVPRAAIHIVDEDWLRIAVQAGIQVQECPRDMSICTRVVAKRDLVVIPDLAEDTFLGKMPYVAGYPGFRFYAGVPLELDPGLVVAAFCILDVVPRTLSDNEEIVLRKLGTLAAGLLRLQRANSIMSINERDLRDAVMTDPLTGFFNRHALEGPVQERLEAALAQHRPFGVLMMDMDGFKSINDTLGHAAGDAVLREAGRRIRDATRRSDIIVRIGGDEFAIFLGELEEASALNHVAEKLLAAFREPFHPAGGAVWSRLSIGGALAHVLGATVSQSLAAADKALYDAKAAGRDRFVMSAA